MAKKNNKGFSLIEIVIAIAILTLLLTPIIQQLAQTMKVSRRAKEQQYINENAVRELEFVQRVNVNELPEIYKEQYHIDIDDTNVVKKETQTCTLYSMTGAVIDNIQYDITEYNLGIFEIGSRKTEYEKHVILDDLSNKVGAFVKDDKSYKVAYDLTEAEMATLSGFTLTNEGSMVKYDEGTGYVNGVVCKLAIDEGEDKILDPNDVNLGNMQDLENDKVAIITGLASNYDAQAEKAFFSKTMDRLKIIDRESWEQSLLHAEDDSVLNQFAYVSAIEKCTKIYIDELTDELGEDYYIVKVDVYYVNTYSLEVNGEVHPFNDVFEYNVFTQKFYTDKCPDIYFEYQPYTVDKYMEADGSYNVTYDDDDYILIDNYVKDAKLYLYKPYIDQMNKSIYNNDINVLEEKYNKGAVYKYYTTRAFSNLVKIKICNTSSEVEQLKIFTNLDTEIDDEGRTQFYTSSDYFLSRFPDVISDREDVDNFRQDFNRGNDTDGDGELDEIFLCPLSKDIRKENRLYTITVKLEPVEDGYNSVILTGAKGEN